MAATHRDQFNIEVTPRMMMIARQLSIVDEVSIPQLLRPVIEDWLESEVDADPDLRQVVEGSLRVKEKRGQSGASVSPIRPSKRRDGADPD